MDCRRTPFFVDNFVDNLLDPPESLEIQGFGWNAGKRAKKNTQ